jgi:hypothetical protein
MKSDIINFNLYTYHLNVDLPELAYVVWINYNKNVSNFFLLTLLFLDTPGLALQIFLDNYCPINFAKYYFIIT